ncbi:hypothetical protein [Micromonospora sp. NPDC048839]|uniref:hypothetical protein n=1 Tax=Micromonospora sp. NPDC048839 TaxID=3155641 RepID=UPI0033F31730
MPHLAAPRKGTTLNERSPSPRFRGYVKVDPNIRPPTSAAPPDPQPADADAMTEVDPEKPSWRRWLGKGH